MSYFVLAVDPDPEARASFLKNAQAAADGLGLPCVRVMETGVCAAVFAAPFAGVLQVQERDGTTCVLLGYALDDNGTPLGPGSLGEALTRDPGFHPDGFCLFARMDPVGRVELCADPAGCFPCYYTQPRPGRLVCATGPGDLLAHPGVHAKPDPEGIAGLLLLNDPLYNRSLFQGVFRLPQHARLHAARERVVIRPVPYPDVACPETRREALDKLEALWRDVFRHHADATPGETDCLLSGGRDSRMVARELQGMRVPFRAVTLGQKGENEVRAARMVGRALNIRHHELFPDEDPEVMLHAWRQRARRAAASMGGTLGGLHLERPTRPWIHHGILVDDVVGGLATGFARDPETGRFGGEVFFRRYNRWGFPVETLARLFRDPSHREIPRVLRERVLADFHSHPLGPHAASFDLKLATRCRYHLGSCLWEFTRQSWPVTPCDSMALLAFCRNLPVEWVYNRALQMDVMKRLNTALVRIPFDGNEMRFEPSSRAWLWPVWRQRLFAAKQPLRYHRVFSPETPAWRAVRAEAERGREALHDLFDPEVLRELWPPFPERLPGTNPFADLAGPRNLMLMASCLASF